MKKSYIFSLFVVCFAMLLLVQGYFIYNTSRLWKSEIYREVSKKLLALEDVDAFSPFRGDDDKASRIIADFELGKITKQQLLQEYQKSEGFISPKLEKTVNNIFKKSGYKVAVRSVFESIYSVKAKKYILKDPIEIYKVNNLANGKDLSTGMWKTSAQSFDTNHPKQNFRNNYHIASKSTYEILNLDTIIFWKIFPLILVNIAIIALLLYVFRRTLQNLSAQQKRVAQLHTTIDSISHELNTPITTMKFSVAGLKDKDLKSLLERQIARIENISERMHQNPDDNVLVTAEFLDDYFKNIQPNFPGVCFQISSEFQFNKTLYQQDFELMMNNLIENSVKYKSSKIIVEAVFSKEIMLSVSDDGIGIPENEMNHIFNKYYRISRPENLQINGLGLGLFLIKEKLKDYAGNISVKKSPEGGAVFRILIPQKL